MGNCEGQGPNRSAMRRLKLGDRPSGAPEYAPVRGVPKGYLVTSCKNDSLVLQPRRETVIIILILSRCSLARGLLSGLFRTVSESWVLVRPRTAVGAYAQKTRNVRRFSLKDVRHSPAAPPGAGDVG